MKIYGYENNIFILKEIGNRIKDIRISKSMTQKELALNAGVAHSTVIRVENGEGANLDNLIKIIRILGFAQNFDLLIPEQEMTPEDIDSDAPLFGEGLGLDSIDALELIVLMERNYGIKLANASEGKSIFQSVRVMAEYISKNRTK